MFGLRRLQSNPPRSLWLQHIHWMCCLTRRAQPPFPLCIYLREPTASASRGATLSTHIEKYRPLIVPLVHGRKKSTLARSLVQSVKFGVRFLAAVAARVPSSNKHIPFISKGFHHCPQIINKIMRH